MFLYAAIVPLLFRLDGCRAAFVRQNTLVRQNTPSRGQQYAKTFGLGSLGNDYLSTLSNTDPSTPKLPSDGVQNPPAYQQAPAQTQSASTFNAQTPVSHPAEISISGVPYELVTQGLDILYPPTELSSRNAKSRTDGYWPFIEGAGSKPPQEFTYGEFDAHFFAELLDQAVQFMDGNTQPCYENKVVCDIGSGTGRLVLGAAALHPTLSCSQGIEILPGIHEAAVQIVANCQGRLPPNNLPLAPIDLACGSASEVDISKVDVFFMFSSCMPPNVLEEITQAIGQQCKVGTIIICTEYELTTERSLCQATGRYFQLEKMAQTDGSCSVVGGISTAHTYKLIESAASVLLDTSPAPPTDSASTATSRTRSTSGISYEQVAEGLDLLYPPSDLASRNAKSRTDGYWPFMKGADSEAPVEFTYGEFDALFFAQLLDQATTYMTTPTLEGKVVCDVGSGAGRLVLGAAALHPGLKQSRGVEILPGIHNMAMDHVANCQGMLKPHNLPLAPIELTCGSISDPAVADVSNVELFFIASTCMPESVLVEIAHAIGRQCRVGTLVISTDYELITDRTLCESTGKYFQLKKLTQTDGYCWVVGGVSTAFTYQLTESAA